MTPLRTSVQPRPFQCTTSECVPWSPAAHTSHAENATTLVSVPLAGRPAPLPASHAAVLCAAVLCAAVLCAAVLCALTGAALAARAPLASAAAVSTASAATVSTASA